MRKHRAVFRGRYNGRRWYLVPVFISRNNSRTLSEKKELVWVLAPSAADAANHVRDTEPGVYNRPETEVTAYGPKGGEQYRYVGWYSCIANQVCGALRMGK